MISVAVVTVANWTNDDDYDDDDRRFVKRIISQNASTALRVPVRCEEGQIPLRYPASEPARELVCDLPASWTA